MQDASLGERPSLPRISWGLEEPLERKTLERVRHTYEVIREDNFEVLDDPDHLLEPLSPDANSSSALRRPGPSVASVLGMSDDEAMEPDPDELEDIVRRSSWHSLSEEMDPRGELRSERLLS